jgi:DNA-directed RNA polymerase subunit omega
LVRNRDIVDETELLVAAPADAVDLAAHRARTIMKGSAPVVDPDYDKNSVIALREIAEKVVTPNDMRERLIHSMQENVEIDESETTAAPRLPEISRPRLGRDDPSIDRKMDTMTEDALLRQRCEGFLPSSRRRVARSKRQ